MPPKIQSTLVYVNHCHAIQIAFDGNNKKIRVDVNRLSVGDIVGFDAPSNSRCWHKLVVMSIIHSNQLPLDQQLVVTSVIIDSFIDIR